MPVAHSPYVSSGRKITGDKIASGTYATLNLERFPYA
jgi:hypothetical protein